MEHVYRHFDAAGALLYVGVSLSAIQRLAQHADNSHWFAQIARVEIQNFNSREEALAAERRAIADESPKHNIKRPKEAKQQPQAIEASAKDIVRQVVRFKPLYTPHEAADTLRINVRSVNQMLDGGKLGFVMLPSGYGNVYRYVTGWQLLEFIEHLERHPKSVRPRLDLVR